MTKRKHRYEFASLPQEEVAAVAADCWKPMAADCRKLMVAASWKSMAVGWELKKKKKRSQMSWKMGFSRRLNLNLPTCATEPFFQEQG